MTLKKIGTISALIVLICIGISIAYWLFSNNGIGDTLVFSGLYILFITGVSLFIDLKKGRNYVLYYYRSCKIGSVRKSVEIYLYVDKLVIDHKVYGFDKVTIDELDAFSVVIHSNRPDVEITFDDRLQKSAFCDYLHEKITNK